MNESQEIERLAAEAVAEIEKFQPFHKLDKLTAETIIRTAILKVLIFKLKEINNGRSSNL